MEPQDIARFVGALALVLGLIAFAGFVARRFGIGGASPARGGRARRLSVTESIALDPKRRLVLARLDDREHLLLLGPSGDVVVERSVKVENSAVPAIDVAPPGGRQEPSS